MRACYEVPESRARDDIRAEIVEEVPLTLERPARDATLAFAATVQRLRWSNRQLTYYVSHSAREEAAKENWHSQHLRRCEDLCFRWIQDGSASHREVPREL